MRKRLKYIRDKKGNKTAVVIPFNKYLKLLEDLDDLTIARKRKNERDIPFTEVKKRIRKKYG